MVRHKCLQKRKGLLGPIEIESDATGFTEIAALYPNKLFKRSPGQQYRFITTGAFPADQSPGREAETQPVLLYLL